MILRGHLAEDTAEFLGNGRDQQITKSHCPLLTAGGIVGHFGGSDAGREPYGRAQRNDLWATWWRGGPVEGSTADHDQDEGNEDTAPDKIGTQLQQKTWRILKIFHRLVIQNMS